VPKQVNIYEAKSQFSKLIDEVEAGAEIVIARSGRPVARLVPVRRPAHDRVPGSLAGKIWIAPDFDEPDEEIIDRMANGPILPRHRERRTG
jgi:prevent-host-death family protein